jgi:hypothetical protein
MIAIIANSNKQQLKIAIDPSTECYLKLKHNNNSNYQGDSTKENKKEKFSKNKNSDNNNKSRKAPNIYNNNNICNNIIYTDDNN